MMKPIFYLVLFFSPLVAFTAGNENALEEIQNFIDTRIESGEINKEKKNWKTNLPKFPEAVFEDDGHYEWILETSEGTIISVLDHDTAPNHVRNILYLSRLGFYDGLKFHRIIPGFMAQGGCPLGRGTGGPGYQVDLEVDRAVKHKGPGVLSMARSQRPNSAGSQFFITFRSTPSLDNQYSVFGKMTDGMEVLKKLEAAGNPRSNGVPPLKIITIEKATVRWVGDQNDPS